MISQAIAQAAIETGEAIKDPFEIPARLYALLFLSATAGGAVTYVLRFRATIKEDRRIDKIDFVIELASANFVAVLLLLAAGYIGYPPIVMLLIGTVGAFFNRTAIKTISESFPKILQIKSLLKSKADD